MHSTKYGKESSIQAGKLMVDSQYKQFGKDSNVIMVTKEAVLVKSDRFYD